MRRLITFAALPLALVAACNRADRTARSGAMNDDLKKDLELAAASDVQLASAARAYRPTRFVSAIEEPEGSAPAPRAKAKHPMPTKAARTPQKKMTPVNEPTPVVASAPSPVPIVDQVPAPQTPPVEVNLPRPRPIPADNPVGGPSAGDHGSGGGLGDIGRGIGGIIGVVIRGGGVGDDHCVPNGRGGPTGMPVPIGPGGWGGGRVPINPPFPRGGRRY